MLEIKLKEEYDEWLRKIAQEVSISPEELAYMSIEKFINEYRTRKAVRAYVEVKYHWETLRKLLECQRENLWQ